MSDKERNENSSKCRVSQAYDTRLGSHSMNSLLVYFFYFILGSFILLLAFFLVASDTVFSFHSYFSGFSSDFSLKRIT